METKDTLSSCSNSEEQQMQQIQGKVKKSCMVSFRQLHSHLKLLSNNDLKGTRTECGFKHAFATLFGQDVETFTGTMFLNMDQLEKQLDNEEFQEIGSMAAFKVLETQFQMFIKSRIYLDDEYVVMTRNYFLQYTQLEIPEFRDTLIQHMESVKKSIDKRALHKREYDSWVNERQMQTTEEKVDTSKALDASLVDTESSGTESKEQDTSSRSGNDAHADDADIRPIYDEEPMAEVQTTAEINVFATGQQGTTSISSNLKFIMTERLTRNAGTIVMTLVPLQAYIEDSVTFIAKSSLTLLAKSKSHIVLGIAPVAIIDRQLPFEYTITSRSTDVVVPISPVSPTDSEYLRSGMRMRENQLAHMSLDEELCGTGTSWLCAPTRKSNKKLLKANGKGNDKQVYIPKPKNPKPSAKEHPAKDDTCHHCKEVGHCKGNCPAYLAELIKKKKKQVGIAISKNNVFYFNAIPSNGIYEIDMHDLVPNVNSIYNVSTKRAKHNLDSTYLWHCRLAYISTKRIEKMQQEGLLKSTDDESFDQCVSCLSGKMTRKSFIHRPEKANNTYRSCGIVQPLTPPYTPQHNGVSERRNRTLLDMVRSMMNLTTLPLSFWDYALESVTRILNMVPTKKGCEALMKRDTPDKLQQRSVKCIFIGYPKETMGYCFYFPPNNKIVIARYAEFFEKNLITQEVSGRAMDLEEIQDKDTS
ncbi:retrotransposon protein, putative, ty1-copia subclass [Tanacetum coccineum]